jgi:hypothetical protein
MRPFVAAKCSAVQPSSSCMHMCQKRPNIDAKVTYYRGKRDLLYRHSSHLRPDTHAHVCEDGALIAVAAASAVVRPRVLARVRERIRM